MSAPAGPPGVSPCEEALQASGLSEGIHLAPVGCAPVATAQALLATFARFYPALIRLDETIDGIGECDSLWCGLERAAVEGESDVGAPRQLPMIGPHHAKRIGTNPYLNAVPFPLQHIVLEGWTEPERAQATPLLR